MQLLLRLTQQRGRVRNPLKGLLAAFCTLLLLGAGALPAAAVEASGGSEADIQLVPLELSHFKMLGGVDGHTLLLFGLAVCVLGGLFGLWQFVRVQKMPAHKAMLEMSELIYETCKTYLIQQGKFLIVLEIFIGIIIFIYFFALKHMPLGSVMMILASSVIGILGSYSVAWFGCRMNTYANSRTAFASLTGKPYNVYSIPIQAGMSIGVLLISLELVLMLLILLFVPVELAGACFVGFAVGESLGASALRICGGIFTKIADIGSDLMKITFNIKEDDARNPGVIADCTGDNAGDSVGPTADGFETYGVTGVALISFICLAVGKISTGNLVDWSQAGKLAGELLQADLLVWIFVMRVLMIVTSLLSYFVNEGISRARFGNSDHMDFEQPLTSLVWLTSLVSILMTFLASFVLLSERPDGLWWKLSVIISCGTIAAAIIPELTKAFTSANSDHVAEVVDASREGGASLTVLSGMVAGFFSAFWMGLTFMILMGIAYYTSTLGLSAFMIYPQVFAFGLVAFGMLGMGPVTIAVDSYGPVTDNAQSIYELSLIEEIPNISEELEKDFGFKPHFDKAKHFLEANDGAGNTFKATAKPVLIGTAVVGATTMIFSIILLLQKHFGAAYSGLDLVKTPEVLLGLIAGGATVYWFCGASMQAVTTGSYRAVEFIKANIRLEGVTKASVEDSRKVVAICTQYAQAGMINIFMVVFFITLSYACFNPYFFVAYLVSIAVFGLFQAIFMANAGGAWDNAKKVVEVDLKEKGTDLHAATVVGDTVGDPFKDTSSVALNPIIKFTTLFGLLAEEMAVNLDQTLSFALSAIFLLIALVFVWRSFYGMRISSGRSTPSAAPVAAMPVAAMPVAAPPVATPEPTPAPTPAPPAE